MAKPEGTKQTGFSLIELMVAMVITLIVSGAIYGLLASGGKAFRQEPELSDRQQNIRVAMEYIRRDAEAAGDGMTPFVQAFTDGLAGQGPVGPTGANSDYLQILANDGSCPTLDVCGTPGDDLFFGENLPACLANSLPSLGFAYGSSGPAVSGLGPQMPGILYFPKALGGAGCGTSHLHMPKGQSPVNPGGITACGGGTATRAGLTCQLVSRVSVARYQIYLDTAELTKDGPTPSLWRSPMGLVDPTGTNAANQPPNPPWQLVARGIEDLQVRYLTTKSGVFGPSPGTVDYVGKDYSTIVRQVQITLSARSTAANLTGQTTSAAVGDAVRGQLVSVISPRAALLALQQGNLWR